jgi:predicted DNA-binding transcriptional regulator AlpA
VSAPDKLLTARQVGDWLGLAPATILDRFEAGELPGFRLGAKGGPVRFDEEEVRQWLQGRRHGPVLTTTRGGLR